MLLNTTRHFLILDGHKVYLTLKVLTKAKANGIDKLTLPFHTSYDLQSLDVDIFKPFKIAFKAFKNS